MSMNGKTLFEFWQYIDSIGGGIINFYNTKNEPVDDLNYPDNTIIKHIEETKNNITQDKMFKVVLDI